MVVEKVSTTEGAGESWGRAGTGTQIGGSQESNMPLVNAIQPFARRRRAWLYRGATAGSGAKRIQGQAKKKKSSNFDLTLLLTLRKFSPGRNDFCTKRM